MHKYQHGNTGNMRKQGNNMFPKVHSTPIINPTNTKVEEILDKEFKKSIG